MIQIYALLFYKVQHFTATNESTADLFSLHSRIMCLKSTSEAVKSITPRRSRLNKYLISGFNFDRC
jgi:hypothetical protein